MVRSIGENLKVMLFFSNNLPSHILDFEICILDISKSITARIISRFIGENLKKKLFYFFLNYLPLQIWTLKSCNHNTSKTITARSFRLGQLIEDDG